MWRGSKVLTRSLGVRNASVNQFRRGFVTDAEQRIAQILKKELNTSEVTVVDTSNGCGAMYDIEVAAKEFEGKSLVQQHMRINDLLKDEISKMHGLRIKTKPLSTKQ